MPNPFRHYEFEVYDFKSGNHLASGSDTSRLEGEPYSIGDEFIVGDFALFKNNSKRTRKCIIKKVERIGQTNKYNIFVEPTKEDVKFGRNLLEDLSEEDEDGWWKKG